MDIILRIEDESFAEDIRIMKRDKKGNWMDIENVRTMDEILSTVYDEIKKYRPDIIEDEE